MPAAPGSQPQPGGPHGAGGGLVRELGVPESVRAPPASGERPTPPAFDSRGLCRPRRGGGSGCFLPRENEIKNLLHQFEEQSWGSLARCPTCRARRAQAAAWLSHRSTARLGSRDGCGRGSDSARGMRAPRRLLVGAEEIAPARSRRGKVLPLSPASLCSQTFGFSTACPHPKSFY